MKPQYAEQRSLRDIRRGVALLGVADASLAGRRFSVEGMRVEAMGYRDLALLVRTLRGDEVQRVCDREWMAREAQLQVRLCDRLIAKSSLLPSKTGTVFTSSAELDSAAAQMYRRWRRALGRVAGKQEWLLLGYTGPHPVPAGDRSALIGKALTGRRAVVAPDFQGLWESAAPIAHHARLLAPRDARAAFAAAFLIAVGRVAEFQAAVQQTIAGGAAAGITIYRAGPRAPYHFS